MIIVESYPVAVALCVVTMLGWGSWAKTQKLASRQWRFQLFYWDFAIGVFLLALLVAFTLGSSGIGGRGFIADLQQANRKWLGSAFIVTNYARQIMDADGLGPLARKYQRFDERPSLAFIHEELMKGQAGTFHRPSKTISGTTDPPDKRQHARSISSNAKPTCTRN